MDFVKFFNINFASLFKKNCQDCTVENILNNYNKDDKKISKDEVSIFFNDCGSKRMKLGIFIFGKEKIIEEIFKILDGNCDGIKDGTLSYDELNKELNKYKIDIYDEKIRNLPINEFCNLLNIRMDAYELEKRAKKILKTN